MFKVGILLMGKIDSNQPRVKEIVLEVESKTRIKNLFEYLLELDKITHENVYIALEKRGRPVAEDSTMSQILKHVRPDNGLIKLYLYEGDQHSLERLELKRSRNEIGSSSRINPEKAHVRSAKEASSQ